MEIWHKRIKELRENTDITLKDMARIIGVSEATVQRYESGKIYELPYKVIEAYARVFNTNPSYIMGWTNDPKYPLNYNSNYTKEFEVTLATDTMHVADEERKKEEKVILECYRDLPENEKEFVKRMLNYHAKFQKLYEEKQEKQS